MSSFHRFDVTACHLALSRGPTAVGMWGTLGFNELVAQDRSRVGTLLNLALKQFNRRPTMVQIHFTPGNTDVTINEKGRRTQVTPCETLILTVDPTQVQGVDLASGLVREVLTILLPASCVVLEFSPGRDHPAREVYDALIGVVRSTPCLQPLPGTEFYLEPKTSAVVECLPGRKLISRRLYGTDRSPTAAERAVLASYNITYEPVEPLPEDPLIKL